MTVAGLGSLMRQPVTRKASQHTVSRRVCNLVFNGAWIETTPCGYFPDVFLPGPSPWKRAFLGTLVGLLLLLALLMAVAQCFFLKRRRSQGTRRLGGAHKVVGAGLGWAGAGVGPSGSAYPPQLSVLLFRKAEGAGGEGQR